MLHFKGKKEYFMKILALEGLSLTLGGFVIISVSYILLLVLAINDFSLFLRDFGIGIVTAGLVVLLVETKNKGFYNDDFQQIVGEELENTIRKIIKVEYLKSSEKEENEIKKTLIDKFIQHYDKEIKGEKLKYFIDLMNITGYPGVADTVAQFYSNEVKKRIRSFNKKEYALLCPKSENTYLATKIANFLEIPAIFVNLSPEERCSTCSSDCLLMNDEKFIREIRLKEINRLFDGEPLDNYIYILFDDVTLTAEKLCFSAAVTKLLNKNVRITHCITLIRREEVEFSEIKRKLDNFVENTDAIWIMGDDEIRRIKGSDNGR